MAFRLNWLKIAIKRWMIDGCMMFGCRKRENDIKKSIKHNILIKREQRKGESRARKRPGGHLSIYGSKF